MKIAFKKLSVSHCVQSWNAGKKHFCTAFFADLSTKKKVLMIAFAIALVFVFAESTAFSVLLADSTSISVIPKGGTLGGKFSSGDFHAEDVLAYGLYLIKTAGVLAGVIYMLMNVWAGIRYITGSLEGENEIGKTHLINAFIGFGIVIFSWIFVDIVMTFFMP